MSQTLTALAKRIVPTQDSNTLASPIFSGSQFVGDRPRGLHTPSGTKAAARTTRRRRSSLYAATAVDALNAAHAHAKRASTKRNRGRSHIVRGDWRWVFFKRYLHRYDSPRCVVCMFCVCPRITWRGVFGGATHAAGRNCAHHGHPSQPSQSRTGSPPSSPTRVSGRSIAAAPPRSNGCCRPHSTAVLAPAVGHVRASRVDAGARGQCNTSVYYQWWGCRRSV